MSPDMEKKKQPLPSWLRLLLTHPFYLLHFLAFLSYLTFRTSSRLQILLPHLSHYSLLRKVLHSVFLFVNFLSLRCQCWWILICSVFRRFNQFLRSLVSHLSRSVLLFLFSNSLFSLQWSDHRAWSWILLFKSLCRLCNVVGWWLNMVLELIPSSKAFLQCGEW